METKHTPGPWEAKQNTQFWDITPVDDSQHFASVWNNPFLNVDAEVQAANAKLIAAAPELLEALQNLLTVVEYDGMPDTEALACIKARNIINQATS